MATKKVVKLIEQETKLTCCRACGTEYKDTPAFRKLTLSVSGTRVAKEMNKLVTLIKRLQEDDLLGPEVCAIGAELVELQRQLNEAVKKRNRDYVEESSVIRVERVR
jgi:hypothetical protein